MRLIFFGPPGVGKGTQAERLADRVGVPHISTGAIFRAAMQAETPLGNEVKGFYDRGALVPDELTTAIVVEALADDAQKNGFILDGYPRNLSQAEALDAALAARQESIDRVKNQIFAGLKNDATDPSSIASQTFDRLVWGDHPYGSSRDGTEESVAALTRDDILDARARVLGKDRIYVSAVGDITASELSDLLDSLLGDLPDATAPLPEHADDLLKGGVKVVPFDTPQSVALFGHQGITRDDPDFMGAYLLNEVFGGGGFESRLMEEVREKRGLTYGISTFLAPMESGELILGQVRSDNSKMAETIDVIRDEWKKIATDGITQEELENAKKFLTGAYALRFDGNGPIAQIMVGMQMSDLPADYIRTRNDQIDALTLEDVNRIAKRIYQPENLFFVVVGQPEGVTNSVE